MLYCNKTRNAAIQIIGLARSKERVASIFRDDNEKDEIKFIYNDIRVPFEIDYNIDYILHTACPTNSKQFITNPVEIIDTIYFGTRNLFQYAREHKILGITYISSMEIYGIIEKNKTNRNSEDNLGKIDILNVRSSYSEGKRLVECLCRSYFEEYGIPVNIARLAQTFGPGISKDDNRIFMQLARSVINRKDIVLHTTGQSYSNFCYTRDAVRALLLLMTDGTPGEAYNIVNEESTMKIVEIARLVANKIANGQISVKFDIPNTEKTYGYAPDTKLRLSAEKIQRLGWKPEVNLLSAYIRLINYLEN